MRLGKIKCKSCAAVLQVGAGANSPVAGDSQHDDANVRIVLRIAITASDSGDDVGVDCIALLGSIDSDPECVLALFKNHNVVTHYFPLLGRPHCNQSYN